MILGKFQNSESLLTLIHSFLQAVNATGIHGMQGLTDQIGAKVGK
jgi:hypothetical protein